MMNILSFAAAAATAGATALFGADEGSRSSTVVDGQTTRAESVSANQQRIGQDGRSVKTLTISFAVDPRDGAKSFAYEIGQRFVALDAAGQPIPLGRVQSFARHEPFFRLAGYPSPDRKGVLTPFRDTLTAAIPLRNADVKSIATLEGDLFVSDVELIEFTFKKEELDPNVVKKVNGAEAKLFLFDESPRGVDIGFKLLLPPRSRAEALTGGSGSRLDQVLLFATEGGRKWALTSNGRSSSGGGIGGDDEDPRTRSERQFQGVPLDRRPEALHLVVPLVEYPRRLPFRLKNVAIPPAPQVPGRPIGPIARLGN